VPAADAGPLAAATWHTIQGRPAILVDLGADYGSTPFAWCLVEPTLLLVGARTRVDYLVRTRGAQLGAMLATDDGSAFGAAHGLSAAPAIRVEANDLITVAGQAGLRVVPALPDRVRLLAWVASDASVAVRLDFRTAGGADAFEALVPRALEWLRTDSWMVRLGLSALADHVEPTREPLAVSLRADLDEPLVRRVLLLLPLLLAGGSRR
jgi:hypothetical protein